MRDLGFISTGEPTTVALYWQLLLGETLQKNQGKHAPRILAEHLHVSADSRNAVGKLQDAARRLENNGAQAIVLGTGLLQTSAGVINEVVDVPVLHISGATAAKLQRLRLRPPALLGLSRSPNEEREWRTTFATAGIKEVILPTHLDRSFVDDQLARGLDEVTATSDIRAAFTRLSVDLKHAGARVIVLTRPELAWGLREEDTVLPTLCAVRAHCEAAVTFAVEGPGAGSI
jgi:aspartate racemase